MTAITANVRVTAAPRGALVAADLFARASAWLARTSTPRQSSHSEQAATVRELANRVQYTDPGFAADLYAAAARHESLTD